MKVLQDFTDQHGRHLFIETDDGKKYSIEPSGEVSISYHPFRTKRYITKWITSEKTLAPIRKFISEYIQKESN